MQEEAIDHHSSVSESESGHSNLYESDDSNADETINDFDQLPHFANDENKRLHAEIRQKTEYLLKLTQNVEDNKNRISIMLEHMKNVENELSHSRQIVSAKQNEIATEKQLSVLAEKERHRLNSETKRSEHEIMEHQNRINHVHNEIFEVTEKIESFKLRMNWKNEELQQWTLAAKQKEEDQLALERYKRADELKIKNLNIELESVSTEYKQVEKSLQTEIAETKAIQVELDNAASEFKSLHDDRVDVINKWDDSVKQIHHKDGQIIEVAKNVDALKQVVHEHDQEISRKKQALLAQVAEEKNMQRNIEKLTRELEKLRKDAMSFQQVVKHETNEVMLVQNELSKIDKESKMALFKIKNLAAMNEEYVKKLDAKKEKLQQKIGELQHAKKNLIDTEKETNDIDLLLSEHEAKLSAVLKVESNLKKDLFKQQSLLFDLKKQEQNLESEIKGSIATTRNLLSKIDEFDKRSLKQGEALYSLDFQIQQLERKVSRAAGKRTREEQIELNEKISALSNKLDMQKKHESDLSGQVKKFNDDLRNAKRVSVEMANKKQAVEAKINDVNLENEAIEQELAELDKEKNKLFLAHDEEKLHINKIRGQLAQITEKVFVLESQKIELAAVVAKELHEMQQINEINCIQLKNKQTILHSTKVEFTKCQQKINTLKARYSTLAGRTRPSNSEDGEGEQSQAYIMIKRAQTKQELQDRGNMLDAEIQKTERELKLLYKSLSHLNHGNDLYRQSLTDSMASMPVEDDESHELEQVKMQLTSKYRKVSNSLYKHKETLKNLKYNTDENESRIKLLMQQIDILQEHIAKYCENDEKLNRKLKQQQEKLKRAVNELKKKKESMKESVDEEKQVLLKDLKRKEKSMTEMIKYLDDILQQNNVYIEELQDIKQRAQGSQRAKKRSDTRSVSTSASLSVASSRPSSASTAVSSVISVVSLSPQF